MSKNDLGSNDIQELFQQLSDRLHERGETARLFVVGGAAMALVYDGSRLTRDVDALFQPTQVVREIAKELGEEHDLETDWLNDAAKGFMPGNDQAPIIVFQSANLLIEVPSATYMLAMKLHAARDERDLEDAATLFNSAKYRTADQCMELLLRTYPASLLQPKHKYVVEDVVARASAQREAKIGEVPASKTAEPVSRIQRIISEGRLPSGVAKNTGAGVQTPAPVRKAKPQGQGRLNKGLGYED